MSFPGINSFEDMVKEWADSIIAMGFIVHMSKSGTHGFITDETETRVLSFEFNRGAPDRLSGNYGPANKYCGTGWVLDEIPADLDSSEKVVAALYAHPPQSCQGWEYFTTVQQHLEVYKSCCGYEPVKL